MGGSIGSREMKYRGAFGLILGLVLTCGVSAGDRLPATGLYAVRRPGETVVDGPDGDLLPRGWGLFRSQAGILRNGVRRRVRQLAIRAETACLLRSLRVPQGRLHVWGEFLYLNARDSEVAFAVPIDGPIIGTPANNPIPIGPVAVLDPDYSPGFSVGFAFDVAPCSSLGAEFTHFESETSTFTGYRSHDGDPSLVGTSHDCKCHKQLSVDANGNLDIDFDLVDIDYRHIFINGCSHTVNYLVGVRYGHLDQRLETHFVNNGVEEVFSNVGFDGGGIRFGLEAEKHSCHSG